MDEHIAYANELRMAGLDDANRWPGYFMRRFGTSYTVAEQTAVRMFDLTTPKPAAPKKERTR